MHPRPDLAQPEAGPSDLMHLHRAFCSFGVTVKRLRKGEFGENSVKLVTWLLDTTNITSSKILSAQLPACS